ncbi:membrane protein [Bizionia arctica]|uniref:Membrane protein n=1 Tax=Bizionia arctica TaxID=1495645 RepID=A0A917LRA7_9FLAO|nr:membrane protein [Bizionia arctica]
MFSQSERVLSFHSDIQVDTSSVITVTESIKIYATGTIFKRGITRTIPTESLDSLGRKHKLDFKILSIERDGSVSKYHTEKGSGSITIFVGEQDVFLTEGEYHYSIRYRVSNQIRFYDTYDEIYWNVNGFDWDLPFDEVSSLITLPTGGNIIQNSCYTGSYGSNSTNCSSTNLSETSIRFSSENLSAGENLTVAVGLKKGTVNQPPPPPPPTFFQKFGAHILSGLISFLLLFYYGFTWLKFGKDPAKPSVYPQFEVPEKMTPASVGMIDKQRYYGDLITGSILNLAVKGYLKIEEDVEEYIFGLFKSKRYLIHKLQADTGTLYNEEKVLLSKLFSNESTLVLDGKYNKTIESAVTAFKASLKKQHHGLIYQGSHLKFWIVPILAMVAYGFLFIFLASSYFQGDHDVLVFILFIVLNIVFFLIYQYLIRKPAVEKLRLKSLIEGFKMYMNAAEDKQIAHFNPPNLTPEIFERLLPYAVVLGAEDIWGEKFQNLIDKSLMDHTYQPTWYAGNIVNFSTFNRTLNSSLSNAISSSATPPSSSGSGSGGGGFSGGGGGGGGGGGW